MLKDYNNYINRYSESLWVLNSKSSLVSRFLLLIVLLLWRFYEVSTNKIDASRRIVNGTAWN